MHLSENHEAQTRPTGRKLYRSLSGIHTGGDQKSIYINIKWKVQTTAYKMKRKLSENR